MFFLAMTKYTIGPKKGTNKITRTQINFSFGFLNPCLRILIRAINHNRKQHRESNVQKMSPKEGVSNSIKLEQI